MRNQTTALLCISLFAITAHAADEVRSTLADQKSVAVTIYNQDFALVKDVRSVSLPSGENALAWRDVAAQMRAETALLRSPGAGKGFYLIEQNFDFDLLTPNKLVEKYVGQKVRVIKTHPTTGAETTEEGTILSANEGVVVQFADRIESHPPGRLAFRALPDNLRDRPTLVVRLNTPASGKQDMELSYLTSGLSWQADYVAELSGNDDKLDLSGWVTLTNQSGTTYRNARLQLVAGDVNRVREDMQVRRAVPMVMAAMAEKAPEMRQENLFEYHLYTLDRPTTLADNQTKQVALVSASQVSVKKELVLRGADYYYRASVGDLGQKLKVGVFVEFDNKGGSLGVPLPKGTVRVYKKDSGGNAQFIGEDRIDHTPRNETVRLKLGEAFDVTADKKQTEFNKVAGGGVGGGRNVYESAFQIVLKNAKSEAVTVLVQEPIPGDWEILSESQPHQKAAANTAVWRVSVPAEGRTVLSYKVRSKY